MPKGRHASGRRVGLAALAVACATLTGCFCRLSAPPPVVSQSSPAPESAQLSPVDVYVDDSASMQGYVVPGTSRYRRVVNAVLEKIITAGYPYTIVRFTDGAAGRTSRDISTLHLLDLQFYRATETPLASLLDRISQSRGDRIAVIVSDLVQSERARPHYQFIDALRRAALKTSDVLLLGFRSAFKGKYYVESIPRSDDEFDLELDGSSLRASRAFFVLVLAPSRAALSQFRKYVVDHVAPTEEFYASEPSLVVDKTELASEVPYRLYRAFEQPSRSAATFVGSLRESHEVRGSTAEVTLRLTAMRGKVSLASLTNLRHEVARRGAAPTQWTAVPVNSVTRSVPGPRSAGERVSFLVSYPLPRAQTCGVWETYRSRVRAGRANVEPPGWVGEWSTRDDRSRAQGHLTLNLSLVVEAMIRAITEEVILTEQYIRVGRES